MLGTGFVGVAGMLRRKLGLRAGPTDAKNAGLVCGKSR